MVCAHHLTPALIPNSVAVIGASDRAESRGTVLWKSLMDGNFSGKAYPVNPKYDFLGDVPCYKSIKAIEEPVDLAVIATSTKVIEKVLEEVAAKGTRFVVLTPTEASVTSNPSWQAHIVNKAHSLGIRLIGTDCLGIMRPEIGFNASYWMQIPNKGSIGFAAQSGVISTSVLSYAQANGLGFSSLVNTTDEIDVTMDEVVDFMAQDRATRVIVLHVEGIRNPREFFSAVREAARVKPVIVLRGGKSLQAGQLLASRMSVPAGDDDAFNALLDRAGAIRVYDLDELLAAIEIFSSRRLPRANRIGIISNGSGFGVLAADAASKYGVKLANLTSATTQRLGQLFDNPLPFTNPVDLWADADPRRMKLALDALNQDENVDGIIVIAAPTFTMPVKHLCDALSYATESTYKPVITAWVGEEQAVTARHQLDAQQITAIKSPERAVQAFSWLSRHAENRRFIAGAVAEGNALLPMNIQAAQELIGNKLQEQDFTLDELETKRILASMGLSTASGIFTTSPVEAADAAQSLGFPVVLKVLAEGVVHKSNVGGVRLNVRNIQQALEESEELLENVRTKAPYAHIRGIFVQRQINVENGRELRINIQTDSRFGPVIRFGAGGRMGDIYQDSALELLPLTEPLARKLIEKPQIAQSLNNFRGMPEVNKDALVQVLLRLSTLVTEIPAIRNLNIDPLLVDEGGCVVLDAHIGIADMPLKKDQQASHLMLSPAPVFDHEWLPVKNGFIQLRSIREHDYDAVKAFLSRLSPQTAYLRFHISSTELAREKLVELTNIDYNRETAIVAFDMDAPEEIRAVARFKRLYGSSVAEFGVIVEDAWQQRGLARILMTTLAQEAKKKKITKLVGYVLKGNEGMFALMKALGYQRQEETDNDNFITFTLTL